MRERDYTVLGDFLRATRQHQLTIENDAGVFRTIYLGRPDSRMDHWRLTTWPGHLAMSGDRGTYVFSRDRDMFEFFRPHFGKLEVNPRYWHEKMLAGCKYSQARVFSRAAFKDAVKSMSERWETTLGDADTLRKEIESEVLAGGCSNQHEAYERLRDFESSQGHQFEDFGDYDLTTWSDSFVWALYAIVWGIKKYDQVKEGRTQADHDRRVLGVANQ